MRQAIAGPLYATKLSQQIVSLPEKIHSTHSSQFIHSLHSVFTPYRARKIMLLLMFPLYIVFRSIFCVCGRCCCCIRAAAHSLGSSLTRTHDWMHRSVRDLLEYSMGAMPRRMLTSLVASRCSRSVYKYMRAANFFMTNNNAAVMKKKRNKNCVCVYTVLLVRGKKYAQNYVLVKVSRVRRSHSRASRCLHKQYNRNPSRENGNFYIQSEMQ